jgi:hypothetical protein
MNWKQEVKKGKKHLNEAYRFLHSDEFFTLPKGVQAALRRGIIALEDQILKWEEWSNEN